MAWDVEIGAPFLYIGAAHCPDHDMILSGPAPVAPVAGHPAGTADWPGPYGDSVDQWDDISHPPGNAAHPGITYAAVYGADPVGSWLIGSQIPDGWYTVKVAKRGHR